MGAYWNTAMTVTLPIVIAVLSGGLLQKYRNIQTKTLVDVSLYVLAPSLILYALVDGSGSISRILSVLGFTLVDMGILWCISIVVGKVGRFDSSTRASITLTTVFSNCVNYGLPVTLLAFGTNGFSMAAIYIIPQIVLVNSLGIYIASNSSKSPLSSLVEVVKMPVVYASVAGIAMFAAHGHWPKGLDNSFHVLGDGYSAIVLLVLGAQLAKANWRDFKRTDLWLAVGLRLVIAPIVAKLTLVLLGIHGLLGSVLFVEASMPAAANAAIMIERFGGNKRLVAMTVAVTTTISFFILPVEILMGS
ncbi:AEC family transporter [Fodinisporobacter ferrooxydans]|uniref:AEC family transporter n=1 Tax=Fodinisporobacter ferrooxydans TaxID=2901836 RepID=A0ABY4CQ95_9BACL|nr:AEC family transporter [Alicyclobacillaceae bacterium MYW30-H2]